MRLNRPVGLVGLGAIGMVLAERFLKASIPVMGYRRGSLDAFGGLGGTRAPSIGDLASRCDTIVLTLPSFHESEEVLSKIAAAGRTGGTIIDVTSMPPQEAVRLAAVCHRAGLRHLEAPISGAPETVRDHQATLFVGGDDATFNSAIELLNIMAGRVMHIGEVGTASALKSAATMMRAINTLGAAEAIGYAESFGVKPAMAFEALSVGPSASSALHHRGGLMVRRDYRRRFGSLAEFQRVLEAIAASASTPVGMLGQVIHYLNESSLAGHGELDSAAVYECFCPRSRNTTHSDSKILL